MQYKYVRKHKNEEPSAKNACAEPRARGAGLCPLGQRLPCQRCSHGQRRRPPSWARPPYATGPPPACSWGRRARQRLVIKFYGKLRRGNGDCMPTLRSCCGAEHFGKLDFYHSAWQGFDVVLHYTRLCVPRAATSPTRDVDRQLMLHFIQNIVIYDSFCPPSESPTLRWRQCRRGGHHSATALLTPTCWCLRGYRGGRIDEEGRSMMGSCHLDTPHRPLVESKSKRYGVHLRSTSRRVGQRCPRPLPRCPLRRRCPRRCPHRCRPPTWVPLLRLSRFRLHG